MDLVIRILKKRVSDEKYIYIVIVSSENIVCDRTLNCIDTNLYLYIFLDAIFFFSFSLFLFHLSFHLHGVRYVRGDTYGMLFRNFDPFFFFCISTFTPRLSFIRSCLTARSSPQRESTAQHGWLAGWLREIDNRIAYCTLELSERNTI